MASSFTFYAFYSGGLGAGGGLTTYANFAALPASATDGTLAVTLDTDTIYIYNLATTTWVPVASPGSYSGGTNAITALSGDVTGTGPGTAVTTLATVNANVGTFSKVTVNAKGLVTAATTLSSGDIPNNAANTSGTASNITATSNATITTLSALSLPGTQVTGTVPAATTATNFSGSLSGDVTGTQSSTSVVKVNGASVPTSKTIVGTNSSGQIIDASSATLSNNTSGTASNITATSNVTITTLSALSLPGSQVTGTVPTATTATNFSGSLSGDVTGTQGATSVVKVKGGSLPISATIVGTNGSGQIVDASSAILSNNTSGTAANITALTTKGDLYGFSTTGGRIPVGSNNQVLIADSTQSLGVRWGNIPSNQYAIPSTTIDWSQGDIFTQTIGSSTTYTFTNQSPGTIIVRLTNTSTYTVTWPGTVKWPNATAPVMTTGTHTDIYTFVYDGTNTYGTYVQNY